MKEQNKMGKKWRNEFFGWENTEYLRVFGLVLNTNRTNLGPPQSPCIGILPPLLFPSVTSKRSGGLEGDCFLTLMTV